MPEPETPNAGDVPSGCRFHPRCPIAVDACRSNDPVPRGRAGHRAVCILAEW
jgi:oligopeptide/dipeptide ABC transporter ATP-binding protein